MGMLVTLIESCGGEGDIWWEVCLSLCKSSCRPPSFYSHSYMTNTPRGWSIRLSVLIYRENSLFCMKLINADEAYVHFNVQELTGTRQAVIISTRAGSGLSILCVSVPRCTYSSRASSFSRHRKRTCCNFMVIAQKDWMVYWYTLLASRIMTVTGLWSKLPHWLDALLAWCSVNSGRSWSQSWSSHDVTRTHVRRTRM